MIIDVASIPGEGLDLEGIVPRSIFDFQDDPSLKEGGDIHCRFHVQKVDCELIVQGQLYAQLGTICSRCGTFYSTRVEESAFLRTYPLEESGGEMEMDAECREALLLKVSTFPLCSEACKGRCAQCGKNLNEGACACEQATRDEPSPWDGL